MIRKEMTKEREMLDNLDLLGVTWSFVPVPKVSFWITPVFTIIQDLYKITSFLLPFFGG